MFLRYLIAAFLALHGLVHSMGFAATWRLGEVKAVSASPNLLPSISSASPPALILGVLWLVAMAAFVGAGVELAAGSALWRPLAAFGAVMSLVLCVLWFRQAPIGIAIDAVIIAALAVTAMTVFTPVGLPR